MRSMPWRTTRHQQLSLHQPPKLKSAPANPTLKQYKFALPIMVLVLPKRINGDSSTPSSPPNPLAKEQVWVYRLVTRLSRTNMAVYYAATLPQEKAPSF